MVGEVFESPARSQDFRVPEILSMFDMRVCKLSNCSCSFSAFEAKFTECQILVGPSKISVINANWDAAKNFNFGECMNKPKSGWLFQSDLFLCGNVLPYFRRVANPWLASAARRYSEH